MLVHSESSLSRISLDAIERSPTFVAQHATASRVVKGQDVIYVEPLLESYPEAMIYLVADGHIGVAAANFVAANFHRTLKPMLPAALPDMTQPQGLEAFASELRKALCEAFVRVDNEFLLQHQHASGAVMTVVLLTGCLITVANVGDCDAVLDTSCWRAGLTRSHRVHSNATEAARMMAAGNMVAPLSFTLKGPAKQGETGVGPKRVWPGGLCVSRSIGDFDTGPAILPIPHIKQIRLTEGGCRVILASDGLWDVMSFQKATLVSRSKPAWIAAPELVRLAARDNRVIDDVSVVIVDIQASGGELPHQATAARKLLKQRSSPAGLFSCFRASVAEVEEADGPENCTLLIDVDGLQEYPALQQKLMRTAYLPANGQPRNNCGTGTSVPVGNHRALLPAFRDSGNKSRSFTVSLFKKQQQDLSFSKKGIPLIQAKVQQHVQLSAGKGTDKLQSALSMESGSSSSTDISGAALMA